MTIMQHMGTNEGIKFVDPPKQWKKSPVVKQLLGTRVWLERGSAKLLRHWLREVNEALAGNLIPLPWVPEFVGVTRAAVHKRVKAGGLTVFSFTLVEATRGMLGKIVERETRERYEYAVLSECDEWRVMLIERYETQAERMKGGEE